MTSLLGDSIQRVFVLNMILHIFAFFPLLQFYDYPNLAKHLPPPSLPLILKQTPGQEEVTKDCLPDT